jgi:hypothetical protein
MEEFIMTTGKFAIVAVAATLIWGQPAHAQVTLDVTKITCGQFVAYKITNPDFIAVWISGYFHGARGEMVVDTQQLVANAKKLENYCLKNPEVLVMKAVETLGKEG